MNGLSDLHRHLDGSIRPNTAADLAAKLGLSVPPDLMFSPGMGLDAALERFGFTVSLLQDTAAVQRVAAEMCEDAAAEGVTTLEVRFAPQLHRAAKLADIVDAALAGIDGRAGLVLCALYGQHPSIAEALVAVAEGRPGVVGIDLAGGPAPHHRYGMADYAGAFTQARAVGLGRTVHAGEGRSCTEIAVAISALHAQRIGHGTTLLDDPRVLETVLANDVTIEACLTSNWQTGAISEVDEHPLPQWVEAGVRVCINTDNTLLSGVDAPHEYRRAAAIPGMTVEAMDRVRAAGHAAAFSFRAAL
jgi:adenosine deaminase